MNSNGELGTGDKDAQEEPIILEAIDDKTVMQVSVGSQFAFAIGG